MIRSDSELHPNSGSIGTFLRSTPGVFFASLLLLVWGYGFMVFNFSISIDEELDLSGMTGLNLEWLRSGRWTVYLLKWLVDGMQVVPFFTGMLALVFLAAAAATLYAGFRAAQPVRHDAGTGWLSAAMFSSAPMFIFALCFSTFDASVGCGVFLSVLSALLAFRVIQGRSLWFGVLAAALLALAIGVYQPMLVAWAAALVSFQLAALVEDGPLEGAGREFWRFVLVAVAVGLGGLACYKITDLVVTHFAGKSTYFEGYFNWPRTTLALAAKQLYENSRDTLLGRSFQAERGWRILLAVEAVSALLILLGARRRRRAAHALLLLAILFVLPFILSWFLGIVLTRTGLSMPLRTNFAMAICSTAPVVVAWSLVRWRPARVVFMAVVAVGVVSNLHWLNRAALADYRRYQHDVFLAQSIGREVERQAMVHGPQSVRVAVIGVDRADATILGYKNETLGFSLFEWDQGNPYRVVALFRALGFTRFENPTNDDLKRGLKESEAMDAWPGASSVRYRDGAAIVKLSTPTYEQSQHYGK